MGVFLQCQMPVDMSGHVNIRTAPHAPGHVKEGSRTSTSSYSSSVPTHTTFPTKQIEQALQGLESLLSNKHYAAHSEQVSLAVSFVVNPANSMLSSPQLLTLLSVHLYPELRYLDLLRVCQT